MKRKLYLLCAAVCILSCTACGRRNEPGARYPETTAARTERSTRRTEKRTERRNTTRVGEDLRDMADDAVQGASEAASDAAAKGRELATDAAADVSEAVGKRKDDGEYNADDDGKVRDSGTEVR